MHVGACWCMWVRVSVCVVYVCTVCVFVRGNSFLWGQILGSSKAARSPLLLLNPPLAILPKALKTLRLRSVTFVFFPAGSDNPLDFKNPLDSRIQGIFFIRLVRWIFYPGDFGDFFVTERSAGFVNPGDSRNPVDTPGIGGNPVKKKVTERSLTVQLVYCGRFRGGNLRPEMMCFVR